MLDLTQPIFVGMPHAAAIPAPRIEDVRSLDVHGMRCQIVSLPTHVGTHIDAPSHFIDEGITIDQLPIELALGPAVCLDVPAQPDQPIPVDVLARAGAELRPGDAILLRTGWGQHYESAPERYRTHPYLSVEAADWLVAQQPRLLGFDVVTPELPGHIRPDGYDCPVHHAILGAGIPIIENLNLTEIGPERFTLFVGYLPIRGADGAPARVLALP